MLDFFTTATGNLLAAEAAAGVGHHVALSVVGTDRLPESGYFRAKLAQETADRGASDPLLDRARDAVLRVHQAASPRWRPTATRSASRRRCSSRWPSDDVAAAVGRTAVGCARQRHRRGRRARAVPASTSWSATALEARNDPRKVVADPQAPYFGIYKADEQHARARRRGADRRGALPRLARAAARDRVARCRRSA